MTKVFISVYVAIAKSLAREMPFYRYDGVLWNSVNWQINSLRRSIQYCIIVPQYCNTLF